jgi:hypothetical protein
VSARRGLETAFATATVYRGETRFDRGPGSHELQSRIAIDQWQSSANRSGGRQPAVGEANVLAQKNEFVVRGERQNQERRASARRGRDKRSGAEKRICRAWRASESRAAGVSPPWLASRACNGDRLSRSNCVSRA